MVLELIIVATVLISLVSLAGISLLGAKKELEEKILFALVSLSAGTLLGGAFLDVLPESLDVLAASTALSIALLGMLVFFVLEKIIVWHHHHTDHENHRTAHEKVTEKPMGYLNLVGDALHNFFDGVAVAAAFLASPALGLTTTFAVLLHEIPQEIGDYSLLIYSGFTRKKALLFNLGSAVFAIVGALLFYFAAPLVQNLAGYGLAFTAGMFIYIAAADIVPELHREKSAGKSALQFVFILIGIALIWLVTTLLH
ncbi:MAG: ZIP family metal transporter [Candidatus Micrarchaeota archaeon]|nr:ZIP family metal transporter [Candidatus Micrarchaeota archaeon]